MEVMIAAGLLGIVTIGVMQITKNMTKSEKTQAQQTEFSQIQNQIQSILRDEYSCGETLIGFSPTGSGTDITQVKRKRSDGSVLTVFQTGQVYGSATSPIFLKKMSIKNFNAATGIGEFYIEMNKGRTNYDSMTQTEKDVVLATSYGTAVVGRSIKMNLVLDGAGKIKDCVSDKDDYTSGACAMLEGDWSDKVKCKSINVSANATEPAITSEGYLAAKNGLTVGSGLATNPGDGSINVSDKATIANDTTITNGKLIFNTGDVRINQVTGNNLYFENKAGTAGANIIAGKSGAVRTTITPTTLSINVNGTVSGTNKLEVAGDAYLSGNSKLTIGSGSIDYNGTDLNLNKPPGKKVNYKDGSADEEIASQGYVDKRLADALTGDSAALTTLLSNLTTAVGANPTRAIAANTCGFYSNMSWNGTACVDNTTINCGAGEMVKGFNNGAINCDPVVSPNQRCAADEIYVGHDANGNKICQSADTVLGTWVDNRITAAAIRASANATCQAKGNTGQGIGDGWFDAGSGGGLGVCRWHERNNYDSGNLGCDSRTNCASLTGRSGGGWTLDSCNCCYGGCCNIAAGDNHRVCKRTEWRYLWCNLAANGTSCGGDNIQFDWRQNGT